MWTYGKIELKIEIKIQFNVIQLQFQLQLHEKNVKTLRDHLNFFFPMSYQNRGVIFLPEN